MSTKKNKTKAADDSQKAEIKFFKIDPDGSIAPAFPPTLSNDTPPLREDHEPGRIEPIFAELEKELTGELRREPVDRSLQDQIDRLLPQVENISRKPERDELTNEQTEILKRYLALKESESRDLKEQARQYQAFLKKLGAQVEAQQRRHRDVLTELETVRKREETLDQKMRRAKQEHVEELALLKSDYEERLRASGNYESAAGDLEKKREEWKEKVREDLKRIKLKERELENKYELLKRDTQALLDSKDKHALDLKKKNDALELEMESLEERLRHGNVVLGSIDAKKRRLIETMKLAISLLEQIDASETKKD